MATVARRHSLDRTRDGTTDRSKTDRGKADRSKTDRSKTDPRLCQRGTTTVEFALISVALVAVMIAVIEVGRYLYLWNIVQEVTRSAARTATVRGLDNTTRAAIQREAIFRGGTSGDVTLPGGSQVHADHVRIRYLNAGLEPASPMPTDTYENAGACLSDTSASGCIRFVEARICQSDVDPCDEVEFQSLLGPKIAIPASTVTMPAEGLGM